MAEIVWVSGASSGIGAAVIDASAGRGARAIGISRRPPVAGEHLAADLADPAGWAAIGDHFAAVLTEATPERAVFVHCAGTLDADGPLTDTDADEYAAAVLLNAAAGPVLGRAFLVAARRAGCRATLVMCSSPAATDALPGLSNYCAGKAALEQWVRAVATEPGDEARVLAVVPHAVDTPMLRRAMTRPEAEVPIGAFFRRAAAEGTLATPASVAVELWTAIDGHAASGTVLAVGATRLAPG